MRKLLILAAAAALTVAGAARADTLGGSAMDQGATSGTVSSSAPTLSTLDKNSDGKISKSEASSNKDLSKQFAKLDSNKDGNLDQAEFARFESADSATGGMDSGSTPSTTDKKKSGGY